MTTTHDRHNVKWISADEAGIRSQGLSVPEDFAYEVRDEIW